MPYKDPAVRRVKHADYRRRRRAAGLEPPHVRTPEQRTRENDLAKQRHQVKAQTMADYWSGWRRKNPDAYRIIMRRSKLKKYGLTIADYEAMLAIQGGVCAICETGSTSLTGGAMAIDHCHKTKVVRGLLCGRCNTMLGQIEENIDLLEAMISYIRRHAPLAEDAR
jgi:Recombination endonuclease VII